MPAFVGRDRETAELVAALDDARQRRGRLALVTGDAGIGKSRLVEELATRAAESRVRVLWGRCWEGDGAPAYWPWVQVLRTCALGVSPSELAELAGRGAPHLARLVPEIADRLPDLPAQPASPDPEHERFVLFDAVASFLRAASEAGPLLVVLDDLHWADRPSLRMLSFVAQGIADTAALVVGCYRDLEARVDPQVAALLAQIERHGTHFPLRGLDRQQVGDLVKEGFGFALSDRAADGIHAATDGNPFFVDEVLRLMMAEGGLAESVDVLPAIPAGIAETIRRHLDLVGDQTRRVLDLCAVCGSACSLPVLERVGGFHRPDLVEALDAATSARLLTGGALGSYAFPHALVRETIYADLAPGVRAELHRRAGEALQSVAGPWVDRHLAEIAHHFFEAVVAGEEAPAVEFAVRAGKRALELLAFEEAAEHFERALRALELRGAEPLERCRVLLLFGDALWRAGEGNARDVFLEAADAARTLDSPLLLAQAALGYAEGLGGMGFTWRADEVLIGLLEEALDGVGESDLVLRTRLAARLAVELYWTDAVERRVRLAAEAVSTAAEIGDPALELVALYSQQWALQTPETLEARLEASERMVRIAEELGDREMSYRAQVVRFIAQVELGDTDQGVAGMDACTAVAAELRMPLYLWHAATWRAGRAILSGDLDDAERLAADALAAGQRGPGELASFVYGAQTAIIRWMQGRFEEAEPVIRAFASAYPWVSVWRASLLSLLAESGRTEDAVVAYQEAAANDFADVPRDASWLGTMWLLSVPCAVAEDRPRAARLYEGLRPFADRTYGVMSTSYGPVDLPLGVYASAAGRVQEAIAHLERALRRAEDMGAVVHRGVAHREYCAALLAAGDTDGAREHLDIAIALMSEYGLEGQMPRVRTLAGRLDQLEASRTAFRRRDDGWEVAWFGREYHAGDGKGFAYLHELLRHPGREVHVLDLVTVAEGGSLPRSALGGDAGPVIDEEAKAAYRERLSELEGEVEEAAAWNDDERAARAREEIEALTGELARGLGLGGRHRRAGSASERARVNVTRAIHSAIRRLDGELPEAAAHLRGSVRTGTFCVYVPDRPVRWALQQHPPDRNSEQTAAVRR